MWVCLCFIFSFLLWSVCSLEGILVPLVRQKCRVEQNLHSTFMVCVGRPICTCLEQIRPAAAHGRPIPCWLFMIKICFGKPRSLDPEIRGSFLLALTPLHIYNQCFPSLTKKRKTQGDRERERENWGVGVNEEGGNWGGGQRDHLCRCFPHARGKTNCSRMRMRNGKREGCTCCGVMIWPRLTSVLVTCHDAWVINQLRANKTSMNEFHNMSSLHIVVISIF